MPGIDNAMDDEIAGWGKCGHVAVFSWDSASRDSFFDLRATELRDYAEDYVRSVFDATWGHRRPGAV